MLHHNRARADSFGADAEQYDRARPSYPPQLVGYLLADGARTVLDVGCGTGIASRLFTACGCEVLGVEPDHRMAATARRSGVVVETSGFERWDPQGRHFDLLISAQAWHWIDPDIGAKKASTLLRSGGRIGLFWNRGMAPTEMASRFDEAYALHAPGLDGYSLLPGDTNRKNWLTATAASLKATSEFTDIKIVSFGHDREYSTTEWLDQLRTHSDHRQLDSGQRKTLLRAIGDAVDHAGGTFVVHYDAMLVAATKVNA